MLLFVQLVTGSPVADRICPGRHVAQTSIFAFAVHMLACYWIAKPLDEHGQEIEQDGKFGGQLVRRVGYKIFLDY